MRTTLDIDDDVLLAVKAIAQRERSSAGAVMSRLARQALTGALPGSPPTGRARAKAVAGFRPFASRGTVVTDEQIDALRDIEGV
jgi:hypothetical protein